MPSLGGRRLPGLAALSFFVGSLRRPILDVHQAAVDRQRARRETEGENLIRQRKVVFDWIARGIVFILHVRLPSAAPPRDGTAPSVRQAGCRSAATESRPPTDFRNFREKTCVSEVPLSGCIWKPTACPAARDFRAGQDIFPQEYFRISRKNDVAQREKTRCLARWRLSDTP